MALESQLNVPRPCAYQSVELPGNTEYYRGAEAIEYSIKDESDYNDLLGLMEFDIANSTALLDQYGYDGSRFANFTLGNKEGLITFFTDKMKDVGNQTVTLRHCDGHDRLFEINLKVEVL